MSSNGPGDDGNAVGMEVIRERRKAQLDAEAKALDQLHASVMMTHHHATHMSRELNDQDRLIGNLEHGVGAANQETRAQTRSVAQLVEQSKNNGFVITVAVLVVIIIILLWV
jgi:predicted ABC-type ATPase